MIKTKKGIESIEVWMWIVAGLIIGAIVFGGSFILFSNWIKNNEIKQSKQSFELLKESILNTCNLGTERAQIDRYVFPDIVKNISVQNKTSGEDNIGYSICIEIEDEGVICEELNVEPNECLMTMTMDTIQFESQKGLFAVIQKALKKSKAKTIDFLIFKTLEKDMCIYWDVKYEDSEVNIEPEYLVEGEQCEFDCQCENSLFCDEYGYCCPDKYYFNGTECISYNGDGICQLYMEENCKDVMDDCSCLPNECCFQCTGSNETGCCSEGQIACGTECIAQPTVTLSPGDLCRCDTECGVETGLVCNNNACACPSGMNWNQNQKICEEPEECEEVDIQKEFWGNPNFDAGRGGNKIDTIVIHYTNGHKPDVTHNYMVGAGNSIHYILGRKCEIVQDVKEKDTAWHANVYAVNQRSIGIEIENLGELCPVARGAYPDLPYGSCINKNGQSFEVYSNKQMNCLIDLVYDIAERNNIPMDRNHIKGHSEVFSAKPDPGPLFNWNKLMNGLKAKEDCKEQQAQQQQQQNNQQSSFSYMLGYADKFAKSECPYSATCVDYRTPSNCGVCGLTCATFVQSIVTHETKLSSFPGWGFSICDYNKGQGTVDFISGPEKAVPGDIVQGGSSPGHTGIVVGMGKGTGQSQNYYYGTCYKGFEQTANGELFVIHSIGNSDLGEPGVCYQPYNQVFSHFKPTKICRIKKEYKA